MFIVYEIKFDRNKPRHEDLEPDLEIFLSKKKAKKYLKNKIHWWKNCINSNDYDYIDKIDDYTYHIYEVDEYTILKMEEVEVNET